MSTTKTKRELFRALGGVSDQVPVYVQDGKRLRPVIWVDVLDGQVVLRTGQKEPR